MEAIEGMSAEEREAFSAVLTDMQLRDSMRMYNELVERCFKSCVFSFTSKTMTAKEGACVESCARKFIAHSQRVGVRFAEMQYKQKPGP